MRRFRLELLLILAVALLIGQLAWPAIGRWWNRPRPGAIGVATFSLGNGLANQYVVYLPEAYGSADQKWPLLVFLHGAGERGHDPAVLRGRGPLSVMQNGKTLPVIVAVPQCVPGSNWRPGAVAKFVRHVASVHRVDETRVYLIGYSMGGYGAWATAAAYPELFAAVVPICGGGEPDQAKSLADIPIWGFHGALDDVVPLSESERMIDAIRAAGGNPKLTILPDAGHGICQKVCGRDDLWQWLLDQTQRPK